MTERRFVLSFGQLFVTECHRCLRRRAVWVLNLIALGIVILIGLTSFISAAARTAPRSSDAAISVTDLAPVDDPAGGWIVAFGILLFLGGLLGGAAIVGGEWRANTVGTVLAREPRRWRLFFARTGACLVLGMVLSVLLIGILVLVMLPTVALYGEFNGADLEWLGGVAVIVAKVSIVTGFASVFGAAFSWIGRNTIVALIVAFVYINIVEPVITWRVPSLIPFSLVRNIAVFITGTSVESEHFSRSASAAFGFILIVITGLTTVAGWTFARRDVN